MKVEDRIRTHQFEWRPEILRYIEDFSKIKFLRDQPDVDVYDKINDQLKDYMRIKEPKLKFSELLYTEKKKDHLKGVSDDEFGVWVYYPWIKKLVHLLPEKEFVLVRTSRNYYKITPEEQTFLGQ